MTNPEMRFWAKVDTTNDDWLWVGSTNADGYGNFGVGSRTDGSRRTVLAHRFAYEDAIGPIPTGMTLDHLCRVRACVRPSHLEPVPHGENVRRGTAGAYWQSKQRCPQGHPYDQVNTRWKTIGGRQHRACRECGRVDSLARYYRSREVSAHD